MSKYTAEDFANAEFARHPDGRIAARLYPGLKEQWAMFESAWVSSDHQLAIDNWVPVPEHVPGRTITEGDYSDIAEWARNYSNRGWEGRTVLAGAGITIVPDPEPTTPEKLPGRTITESDYQRLMDDTSMPYGVGFTDGFHQAGGSIIPDPEPTSLESISKLLAEFAELNASCGGEQGDHDLAEFLNARGVKAGGDDE